MIVLDPTVAMRSLVLLISLGKWMSAASLMPLPVQVIVHQMLLFRKNDEVGIVMDGTDNQLNSDDDNNYKNVTGLSTIAPVSLDLAKKLHVMEAASVETTAHVTIVTAAAHTASSPPHVKPGPILFNAAFSIEVVLVGEVTLLMNTGRAAVLYAQVRPTL
ncbi:hypothetical protein DYB32_009228 [Aphanomyces invadans]|uniref:Uncharacterized protein n=1 Tax=Aphanomyces invadans TaxID=157072 RepID=A0A3R6Y2V7_9STRA|nr:hypothetical protein DYB32_009228 [Aphanomyces invadans]